MVCKDAPEDSVNLYEEILPTCKAKFGPDSRETLQCLNNLAMGLWMLDKHEEAIQIHREVLAIKKVKFGPDDRSTLITHDEPGQRLSLPPPL